MTARAVPPDVIWIMTRRGRAGRPTWKTSHPGAWRQHEIKTRGLVRTRLHPDGSVDTTMLTGLVVTTRPEPLPGHAPGEGHARVPVDAA